MTNNGKTLASFFDEYPSDNIAQLYFNDEMPKNKTCKNFFRIRDKDIILYILKKVDICGNKINYRTIAVEDNSQNNKFIQRIKNYNLSRIMRELLWKTDTWKTQPLNKWLCEFYPDIIFFCAGDSAFAYDITNYIQEKFKTKLIVYITDDYVLPRKTISLLWWLRRNYLLKKMKDIIQRCELFITISLKMQNEYKRLFEKDSILAANATESMKDNSIHVDDKTNLNLIYAGGFHYRRYETLNLLAHALKRYNDDCRNKRKVFLKIYSIQEPSNRILQLLNVEGASKFCGKLNSEQLKEVLNKCDVPVHVESFNRKAIESTRLSISTKIPEYLSLGKPIVAIGPPQIASIEYLKDCAFCITDSNIIDLEIMTFLNNNELHKVLSQKSQQKYEKNHKKEAIINYIMFNIMNIY